MKSHSAKNFNSLLNGMTKKNICYVMIEFQKYLVSFWTAQSSPLKQFSKFYPKKLSTNKSRKKYYPEVLSKIFLTKMHVNYSSSLYI